MKHTTNTNANLVKGTVVTVSYNGLRTCILVGTNGGMSFVFGDFGDKGICCKRVFSKTVKASESKIGLSEEVLKGFDEWCKAHGKEIAITMAKPISKGSAVTKAVAIKKPKAEAKANTKSNLEVVAEALARGGMKPNDVAKVLKALM